MSNRKSSLLALTLLAASNYEFGQPMKQPNAIKLPRDESEYYKSKGLKLFVYAGKQIFALNKESADKKAKKLGLI